MVYERKGTVLVRRSEATATVWGGEDHIPVPNRSSCCISSNPHVTRQPKVHAQVGLEQSLRSVNGRSERNGVRNCASEFDDSVGSGLRNELLDWSDDDVTTASLDCSAVDECSSGPLAARDVNTVDTACSEESQGVAKAPMSLSR